ncbi:MAG: hypothetical protein HY392_05665 [Candidatus Diapherotrites archaeon]|nr:hypothetical protein [Candidatus Diapherotrites archaeon]
MVEKMQQTISKTRPKRTIFSVKRKIKTAKSAKNKIARHDFDVHYFDIVEKRIREQDENTVKSHQDHYVYD